MGVWYWLTTQAMSRMPLPAYAADPVLPASDRNRSFVLILTLFRPRVETGCR